MYHNSYVSEDFAKEFLYYMYNVHNNNTVVDFDSPKSLNSTIDINDLTLLSPSNDYPLDPVNQILYEYLCMEPHHKKIHFIDTIKRRFRKLIKT
jgi:hypothetical protein